MILVTGARTERSACGPVRCGRPLVVSIEKQAPHRPRAKATSSVSLARRGDDADSKCGSIPKNSTCADVCPMSGRAIARLISSKLTCSRQVHPMRGAFCAAIRSARPEPARHRRHRYEPGVRPLASPVAPPTVRNRRVVMGISRRFRARGSECRRHQDSGGRSLLKYCPTHR